MHTSDAFSDYMVTYSVNKSINLSPTHGRLHKVRQSTSLGPTICLINRSHDKIEDSTAVEAKREQELLSKLFMMSMEVQRLTQQNRQLQSQKSQYVSMTRARDTGYMREQNERLKMSTERNNNLRLDLERMHTNQVFELKQKLASMEAENRTLNRRVRENQKELEQMMLKDKINESAINRTRMEASKMMEMSKSMHYNSTNADLGKSIHKQKTMEIDGLNQRINRCQQIIRDQKFIISGQKQELNKEKLRNYETEQKYQRQLDFVKRQLEQSQKQNSQVGQQQIKRLQNQIRDWQSRVIKSEQQLKDKCLIIANQVKSISQYQDRCHQLQRKIQDLEFSGHSRVVRAEQAAKLANKEKERQSIKLRKQMQKHIDEIEVLRSVIDQYKTNIAQKDNQVHQTTIQMRDRIREKQQLVRKLRRKDRDQHDDLKLSKSLSVDNTMISNKLKVSQVNLGHIVNSVMELRDSNDRSTRLLGRKIAAVKQTYYAQ